MVRYPSRNHVCRPRNLSHNATSIPNAASTWPRRHLKHQGWSEMAQIPNKTAAEISDITENTWFTRYPISQVTLFARGTEFMA